MSRQPWSQSLILKMEKTKSRETKWIPRPRGSSLRPKQSLGLLAPSTPATLSPLTTGIVASCSHEISLNYLMQEDAETQSHKVRQRQSLVSTAWPGPSPPASPYLRQKYPIVRTHFKPIDIPRQGLGGQAIAFFKIRLKATSETVRAFDILIRIQNFSQESGQKRVQSSLVSINLAI